MCSFPTRCGGEDTTERNGKKGGRGPSSRGESWEDWEIAPVVPGSGEEKTAPGSGEGKRWKNTLEKSSPALL